MKRIYYYKIAEFVNGYKVGTDFPVTTQWKYGEPEQVESLYFDDFKNLIANINETYRVRLEHSLFANSPYISFCDSSFSSKNIKENKFKSYEKRYELYFPKKYSIKELIENLQAEDFVNWCLDNKCGDAIYKMVNKKT